VRQLVLNHLLGIIGADQGGGRSAHPRQRPDVDGGARFALAFHPDLDHFLWNVVVFLVTDLFFNLTVTPILAHSVRVGARDLQRIAVGGFAEVGRRKVVEQGVGKEGRSFECALHILFEFACSKVLG